MSTILSLSVDAVHNAVRAAFEKSGVDRQDAINFADILIENEREGYASHGIMRTRDYINDIKQGHVSAVAQPVIQQRTDLFTAIDGNKSLGIRVIKALQDTVQDLSAKNQLVHFITIKESHHLGRMATMARIFCASGYFVHGFENYNGHGKKVKPKGANKGLLATNPIVYGIPIENQKPIVFDMTTSVVSEGAVRQHHIQKKPVPQGWIIDSTEQPTQDTALFYADPMSAFLSPLGGIAEHKGFGLGLMAEIFATVFSGAGNIATPAAVGGNSAFFILYKPEAFGLSAEQTSNHVRSICAYLERNSDSVRIPGTRIPDQSAFLNVPSQLWEELLKI